MSDSTEIDMNDELDMNKEFDMNEQGQGDTVDAKGLLGRLLPKPVEPVQLCGSIDDDDYSMSSTSRGTCLIFNHKEFEPNTNLNIRNGTDADAARLFALFKTKLGFDTKIYNNLSVREVHHKLDAAARDDHSKSSAFVCCVLSHGDFGILYGKDGKYPTEDVFAPFRGDVCPGLVGKPKIFFIQACQGDKLDSGVHVMSKESKDSSSVTKIPTHADFLMVYSTVPGFYSWRNTTYGSWFIQALCAALQEHSKDKNLLDILTIVNRAVALNFESCVPGDSVMHLKKQVPFITSTLTRNVKFF